MRRVLWLCLVTLAAWAALSGTALAQTPPCDALPAEGKAVAGELLKSLRAYGCCDDTIASCLQKRPACKVGPRLANEVCRRVAKGEDRAAVEHAIAKRTESMASTAAPVPIDLSSTQVAGDPNAPVTAVLYLCGRCPFCATLEPSLYDLVTTGTLKGKVKLYVRPFPIRSHAHSTEAGMAMIAAERAGNIWGFLREMYKSFDRFDPAKLPEYAVAGGLDPVVFRGHLDDPATRSRLVAAKKEGTRNKVDATPTLFINGRMWLGEMKLEQLQDVLEEVAERPALTR